MSGKRRPYPSGVPAHVVHRGVNRGPVFFDQLDRLRYLEELRMLSSRHGVAVHAYVLMDNHVHLLLTPEVDGAVSPLIRDLCRRYVPVANRRAGRQGTLWDGRHHSAMVTSDRYVLACYRYIELNPVRAHMVRHPGAFRWSSHRANAFGCGDPVLTPHPAYEALGRDACRRRRAYEATFRGDHAERAHLLEATRLRCALRRRHLREDGHPPPD